MPPCHTIPFVQPGIAIAPAASETDDVCDTTQPDACDYCGSSRVEWRKCKLVCADCRQINKSCADL